MSVYSENRNLANKIIAVLDRKATSTLTSSRVSISLKEDMSRERYFSTIYYGVDGKVRIVEDKDKLFFGWNLKVNNVEIDKNGLIESAFNSFGDLIIGDLTKGNKSELANFVRFLEKQGVNNIFTNKNYYFYLGNELSEKGFDFNRAFDYKPFKEFYDSKRIDDLGDRSVYIVRRNPQFLKSLKDKDIIPIVFLYDGEVYKVDEGARRYKRNSSIAKLFRITHVDYLDDIDIHKLPVGFQAYHDISKWEIVDVNIPTMDNKTLHKYEFCID